jgi:hypothetical protein
MIQAVTMQDPLTDVNNWDIAYCDVTMNHLESLCCGSQKYFRIIVEVLGGMVFLCETRTNEERSRLLNPFQFHIQKVIIVLSWRNTRHDVQTLQGLNSIGQYYSMNWPV